MTNIFYRLGVGIYHLVIRIIAAFNPKAKAWVDGRKDNIERLKNWRITLKNDTPLLWMHCASLGEFEQGRPVLEQFRKQFPQYKIALSFYSPSGFEQRKNYNGADWVGYLPADSNKNAHEWLGVLQPSLVIFVKYEFWVAHLAALFEAKIPGFLIAASFREDQLFFKWYTSFFRQLLHGFEYIFTQSQKDIELLKTIHIHKAVFAGDPRVDRVLEIAAKAESVPEINDFKGTEKLLIAGSSWPPDEDILLTDQKYWAKNWKLLIVPHEVNDRHISQVCNKIKLPSIRFSDIQLDTNLSEIRIMVLDKIGMLSKVYRYANLAYIGGGFGTSIHNTLEPAAFNLPIFIGPKYHKFPEAVAFIEQKGAFLIKNKEDFHKHFSTLCLDENRQKASRIIQQYMDMNKGATEQIMKGIKKWA